MLYAGEYEGRCRIYERDPRSVVRELWGGNFSMRRADCLAIGMSNPGFTEHYHADRDFGIRCLEAGLTGVFDRSLSAAHLHERTLAGFIRDARSQGAARVLMPAFHPAAVPPPAPDEFARGLPWPVAGLVRLARRPRAYAGLSARPMRRCAFARRSKAIPPPTRRWSPRSTCTTHRHGRLRPSPISRSPTPASSPANSRSSG